MTYNWQQNDWPQFQYDMKLFEPQLYELAEKMGYVHGLIKGLSELDKQDFMLDLMVTEALNTSSIEGEYLGREDVMSSIRNQLGLNKNIEIVKDKRAKGISDLMISVRKDFTEPLSEEILFSWHKKLLQADRFKTPGEWRTHEDAMQVISGAYGKPRVHFEAPPSIQIPDEMDRYIQWFNKTGTKEFSCKEIHPPIRSAIAHIYFESIHPFEDGNGRIGRALSEKALSQSWGSPIFLSLSQAIESDKKAYYTNLEKGQKSNEVTEWIIYFINMLLKAQEEAVELVLFSVKKAKFFDRYREQLSDRHQKVIRRMLSEGPKGFKGGMNARKYMGITGVSKATATRDLKYIRDIGVFTQESAARATNYNLSI